MLRFLAVIFLSLCVIAMPSYAAVTCGSACTIEQGGHEHDCCPNPPTSVQSAHHDEAPADPSHSSGGRSHHCAAPCCAYVATVLTFAVTGIEPEPLADPLPTAAVLYGSVDHDAVFHPPRI